MQFEEKRGVSSGKALIGIGIITVVVAAYFAVCIALGISTPYAGLLFSFYFGGVEKLDKNAFLPAVVGSLGAIAVSAALHLMPQSFGAWGVAPPLLVIIFSVFCLLTGLLGIIFNPAFMLFLTVITIPAISATENFVSMACSVLVGAVFMGANLLLVDFLARQKSQAPSAT